MTVSVKSYRLIYTILFILFSVAMATAVELVPTTAPKNKKWILIAGG